MSKFSRSLFLTIMVLVVFAFPITAGAHSNSKIFPTFSIAGVARDVSVTIVTYNLPAYDSFDVLMNYMGTRGIGGIKVANVGSGSGGSRTYTFNIPTYLYGQYQIAIRMQSNSGSGYYAYNWFHNNTTGGNTGGPGYNPPGYYYYPTFKIAGVTRNNSVTIVTHNLPPGDQFRVLMGPIGTKGINGYPVTVFNTGSGGTQTLTFSIPAALYGSHRIAIRIQSTTGTGYFAYNWFYNNSTG